MGHRKSIVRLGVEEYENMAAFGQSKHADKRANGNKPMQDKIYSYSTMHGYKASGIRFLKWARDQYDCKTLEDARPYVPEYLQKYIDARKSAWTIRTYASALAKLYHCSANDFGVKLPKRERKNVTQHRGGKEKGHFSEKKHADIVELCKATGLRRRGTSSVKIENVWRNESGRVIVRIVEKGGKRRDIPALNDAPLRIAQKAAAEGRELIIPKVPKYAPTHDYRGQYARALYYQLARDVSTLPREEKYICRKERKGTVYDRAAMRAVSRALGHNRLDVVTAYLR